MSKDKDSGTLTLIGQQKLSTTQLTQLEQLRKDAVTDVEEAIEAGTLPAREDLRKFLGLSPLELHAIVNYGLTLPQMIVEGEFNWVNSNITPERFPIKGSGMTRYKFKIFEPKRNISSEDAVEMMRKDGFPAVHHEAGLAFAREFPNEQLKRPIALLGSSAKWYNENNVICLLKGDAAGRHLHLRYWRLLWSARWGFLGAQEVSGAYQAARAL